MGKWEEQGNIKKGPKKKKSLFAYLKLSRLLKIQKKAKVSFARRKS